MILDSDLWVSDESLPSRGAWIEMSIWCGPTSGTAGVAPLAGSVDRNGSDAQSQLNYSSSRSPRGERG